MKTVTTAADAASIDLSDSVSPASLDQRHDRLRDILRDCRSVCVGYSGGVDSVFLAATAVQTLGADSVLAVTGRSAAYPRVQRDVAMECAVAFGIPHLEIETDEMSDERYTSNPSNRCYFCKSELWPKLIGVARERGLHTVLDGSNADDRGDYRPGFRAAREHGVRSPLMEAGLTKADVRTLSERMGLPTWDQPAAPCLSSRLPYGIAVTPARLSEVERAEEVLRALGFRELRVRHHDDCLRIELAPAELDRALHMAGDIATRIGAGGARVLIDVEGYRRGALNEVLVKLGAGAGGVTPGGVAHTAAGVMHAADAVTGGDHRAAALPSYRAAGFHADIAVVAGADAAVARDAAAALRALGFRYIALDSAAFATAAGPAIQP